MNGTDKELEKLLEEDVETRVTQGVSKAVTIFISVIVTFVIAMVLLKFVWAWVVPDLFPGAVDQGLVAADLTWLVSMKLAILVAMLGGFYPALSDAIKGS